MPGGSYRDQFLAAKKTYKMIGMVRCPALGDDLVHFKRDGFEHLIRKGRKMRSFIDQLRRFRLLKEARTVLEQGKVLDQKTGDSGSFWTLVYPAGNKLIKVIVWQKKAGLKKFLSIMDEG